MLHNTSSTRLFSRSRSPGFFSLSRACFSFVLSSLGLSFFLPSSFFLSLFSDERFSFSFLLSRSGSFSFASEALFPSLSLEWCSFLLLSLESFCCRSFELPSPLSLFPSLSLLRLLDLASGTFRYWSDCSVLLSLRGILGLLSPTLGLQSPVFVLPLPTLGRHLSPAFGLLSPTLSFLESFRVLSTLSRSLFSEKCSEETKRQNWLI